MTREEAKSILFDMLGNKIIIEPTKQNQAILMAIKALEQYPSWIPISEGLPRFNDIVLASTDSDYDNLKVILTVYGAEEYWFDGRIKAWMPRPKEYKPESEVENECKTES